MILFAIPTFPAFSINLCFFTSQVPNKILILYSIGFSAFLPYMRGSLSPIKLTVYYIAMTSLSSNGLFLPAYEEPTTKETDRHILEAAKSGDMEILKVIQFCFRFVVIWQKLI